MRKNIKRSLIIGAGLALSVPFVLSFVSQNFTNNNSNNLTTNLATVNKAAAFSESAPNQLMLYGIVEGQSTFPVGYFSVIDGKATFTALNSNQTFNSDMNTFNDIAYTINILEPDSNVITSYSFDNVYTSSNIQQWFSSISNPSVSTGDFIQLQTNDPYLPTSFNGEAAKVQNITVGIGSNSLYSIPSINAWQYENTLNFTTSSDNKTIHINIPGTDSTKTISTTVTTDSKGNATYTIPSSVPINNEITYYMELQTGENTPICTIYNEYLTNTKDLTYTFNLMKFGSYAAADVNAQGGNSLALTNFVDIPLQFIGNASISFKILGNIKGTYNLFQVDPNNNWSVGNFKNYNVETDYSQNVNSLKVDVPSDQSQNGQTPWTIRPNGDTIRYHFMINTGGITNDTNSQEPFTFKLQMTINAGTYYREVPVFDNLTFQGKSYMISNWATDNGEEYDKEIFDTGNKYYGADFITRGVRFFEPDSEYVLNLNGNLSSTGIIDSFNANYEVKLYDKIWTTYNEMNGRFLNPTGDQLGFNQGWVHLSVFTSNDGGWFTTSHGTYTTADHFYWFLVPGWILFHEIGHIFNQQILAGYFGNEVYTNIYTYLMEIAYGTVANDPNNTGWNSGNISNKSISQSLITAYTDYFKGASASNNYFKNYTSGLRWFVQLLYYFPNYVTKFALFNDKFLMANNNNTWPTSWYPYPDMSWFAYFLASEYHVNVVPAFAIMGYQITNQKLITFIVNNTTSTLNILPHAIPYWNNSDTTNTNISSSVLPEFTQFEGEVMVPTFINPVLDSKSNSYIINGVDNSGYDINIQYNNKIYTASCDSQGKFTITLPYEANISTAVIWATSGGKSSLKQTFYLNSEIINNAYKYTIDSNANGSSFGLMFYSSPDNKLVAEAGQTNYYYEKPLPWAQIFFSMYNAEGQEIVKPIFVTWQGQGATSVSTRNSNTPCTTILLNELNKELDNMQLQVGDVIDITMPTSNGSSAGVTYIQGTNSTNSSSLQYFSNTNGTTTWKIVDTDNGLYPLSSSFISDMGTYNSFTTLPNASIYVNNVLYSTANNIGINEISSNQARIIPNTIYNIELKIGSSIIYQYNSINAPNTSTVEINNPWNDAVYSIYFDDDNINFVKDWAKFSPYPVNKSNIFFTINLIDPTTKTTKFTWSGMTLEKDVNPIDPPSSVAYQIGDIFQINYYSSSSIFVKNVYNSDSSNTHIIEPSIHLTNSNSNKNNFTSYNYYITPNGLSLVPFQMVNVKISGGITSNSGVLTLGNTKYLVPIANSTFTGSIPFYGQPTKDNNGTLEIDNDTYTANISSSNGVETLNFSIPSQTEQTNINNAIKAINSATVSAKINTLVSTITQDNIGNNITGLPIPPSGISYKYINFQTNTNTGLVSFNIEINGPDGLTKISKLITVNFETQTQQDNLDNIVNLINNAKINALPNISTIDISKTQTFSTQITGMPTIPTGMSFAYQNIIVNYTNESVTFNVLVSDKNGNTALSKTIAVTGFTSATEQQVINKNLNDINSNITNIVAKPNILISQINSSNIDQYLNNLPTPLTGMSYKYQIVKINSITGEITFKVDIEGPNSTSSISNPITVQFETQSQITALNNIIGLINSAKITALSNILVTNVSTNQSFANQIKGMPAIPSGMTFTYQNIIVNNTTGDVSFDVLVKDANNNTQTSKTITATGFVVSSTSNPTSTGTNSSSSTPSSSDAGVIAGAAIGSVLGAALIGALVWYLIRRKK